MQEIKAEAAGALLQTTQQLRTHWSGVITTYIGYVIMINAAIWSYFLKSYIDSVTRPSAAQPSYILLAAALSSVILGMWRLYAHYVDNNIAGLYPDFLLYEDVLSVPSDHGITGYLRRNVPRVERILLGENLATNQKLKAISTLVKSKRIGTRGHLAIDLFVLAIILGMLGVSFSLRRQPQSLLDIACFIGIFMGLLFIGIGSFRYQRKPSNKSIEKAIFEAKKDAIITQGINFRDRLTKIMHTQEALIKLLVRKGIITEEELLEEIKKTKNKKIC